MAAKLALTALPVGVFALPLSILGLFVSDAGTPVSLAGLSFRFLYFSALAAERLHFWPFDRVGANGSSSGDEESNNCMRQ